MSHYPASEKLFQRARRSLSGGVSSQFRAGPPHPMFYTRGEGVHTWDADGNRLLDFTLSQGPLILGHSHPAVLDAMKRAMDEGQLYAGQHEGEVELAETLQRLIPCAERMRFSATGSEADHTALRLARYATGRPRFIKFEGHYHGWFDNVSFDVSPRVPIAERDTPAPEPWGGGIPDDLAHAVITLPWNDLPAVARVLEDHGASIAAIITEPVMSNQGCIEPRPGYLAGLRELCDRHGVVLIFDEIITGFRLDLGGAQRYYDVIPDLAVFGKALASGMPLSAVVGREALFRPVEENAVYHAGTMNANNVCIAAALATLAELERDDRAAHRHIVRLGRELRDAIQGVARRLGVPLLVQGPGPMFHVGFTDRSRVDDYRDTLSYDAALNGRFVRALLDRGVRVIGRGLWYVSAAHTDEHVEIAVRAVEEALREVAPGA